MSELFVKPEHLQMIRDILNKYCPDTEVYAYGSRINGKAHSSSDLDLTVKNLKKDKFLYRLRELFSESNIPFLIDINEYESLPENFKKEIDRNNIRIY